jgi:MFS family permease
VTNSDDPDPADGPRPTRALLVDRTFGPWFWGNLASNTGNWLFNVTAAIVVFRLSGSAFFVGLVSVAQFVPLVVLSPVAGAWSDRVDRRRLVFGGQLIAALSATALAVATLRLGAAGLPSAWPVILTALGVGIGGAIAAPALNSLVPYLVAERDLEDGIALTSLTFNVGRAIGPAGAGVLLATIGPVAAFTINAASFVPLLVALIVIRPRSVTTRPTRDRSVRAGLRYVRENRDILLLLAGIGATGFAADPTITLTPPLAAALGGDDTLVAVMVSAFGIAAALTSLIAGRLQRSSGNLVVARAGTLILAASLLLAATAPFAGLAVAAFAATGLGFVLAINGFTTSLQRRLPDELRGRVMALWGVAFVGNRPIAAALHGGAADLVGVRWAVGIAIGVALLGAVAATRVSRFDATATERPDPA